MTVIMGLPAHVLFVHFIVVLAPVTALLEILCAAWAAARRIYFSVGLLAVAAALAILYWLEGRSEKPRFATNLAVAIAALAVGISSIVGVIQIGDSGAQAFWHNELAQKLGSTPN